MQPDSSAPLKPPAGHASDLPWVRLRSASPSPHVYKRMVRDADPKARPGDIVAVYDKSDVPYGAALYNPYSQIALRMLTKDLAGFGSTEEFFARRLERAVGLRRDILGLDKTTDAYRLVYDLGDGLPGLVVDRYGEHLVLDFYSLGMFKRAEIIEGSLRSLFPGAKFVRRASDYTQKMEGFRVPKGPEVRTRIRENGVAFEVEPSGGYKTGFFCDQRDNRLAVAALSSGRRVLDVCSYTGGFGLYAKKLGGASEAVCVELDPEASALARKNANINQVKMETVCVDAFPYLRQAAVNRQSYGLVVLDPHKLISSKEEFLEGRQKYIDFNKLGLGVLEAGGLLVTCSCSGMLSWEDFTRVVRTAAGVMGRRLQILRRSGAGPDHPVAIDYPEGEYLKVLWCRAF